jgi:hypothetical protein
LLPCRWKYCGDLNGWLGSVRAVGSTRLCFHSRRIHLECSVIKHHRISSMVSAFSIAAPEAVLSNTHQPSRASSFENDLISSSV